MKNWRALLLVYRELDVRLRVGALRHRRFHHRASDSTISDAVESFGGFPDLVRELTNGAVSVETRIAEMKRPLVTLTRRAPNEFWPSPDDVDLRTHAPAGSCESVFVFWPQHDFESGSSVPGSAWGLGMGASAWSNGATYAAVANAPTSSWKNEARGEVWLHEWLHGVCHHFTGRGCKMPERDADGAELHGYTRSVTRGWTDYYRDLMNGLVMEGGEPRGIPTLAWAQTADAARVAAR
ncbi:MAG: hypothetical protein M3R59_07495 [Verrucomicrobiota bacterium]|nr:hypothetical protein [Verrucomicrobiota bacterium]